MRIAIIGSGFGVSGHLPAFSALPGVEVAVIADSGSGKIRDKLPAGVAYAASWQEALATPVDAVSVVVPPACQREIVSSALFQKKHVFCDKPFGLNVNEAEVLTAKAATSACATAINYQFRYEPGIQELKRQIGMDVIGGIYEIDFSWITGGRASPDSPWTWRNDAAAGGGVIGAFFSHAADLIWWLTQEEFSSLSGQTDILIKTRVDSAGQRHDVTAEDALTAQLVLKNGVDVSFRITNCQMGGNGMRIEVKGNNGTLVYQHTPPFTFKEQSLRLITKKETREIPLSFQPFGAADTRLAAVCQSASLFVRKARGDECACPASFADGLRAQKVMDALRKAAATGKYISL